MIANQPYRSSRWPRTSIFLLSRTIICSVVLFSLGGLFIPTPNLTLVVLDVLIRTYLIFIGTVMAHEATHGHLGQTRAANLWWGRIALLPSLVPFTNFRRTHNLHHAHTNVPEDDPDYFMKSRNLIELALRAIAMPHHWFFWLRKRGRVNRADVLDLFFNYAGIACVFLIVLTFVGPSRLLTGMVPTLILVSWLLWYPFAVQTHEGFSTDAPETRSHNYYGKLMFWLSLGLSMHREHHLQPKLAWFELLPYVEEAPSRWATFTRDIRVESQSITPISSPLLKPRAIQTDIVRVMKRVRARV